jgi:hypothetical protein
MARIPTTVVTGFLGAGKTTLIRHLLENAGGRRLAVVVNEFGGVGIDGEILLDAGFYWPGQRLTDLADLRASWSPSGRRRRWSSIAPSSRRARPRRSTPISRPWWSAAGAFEIAASLDYLFAFAARRAR